MSRMPGLARRCLAVHASRNLLWARKFTTSRQLVNKKSIVDIIPLDKIKNFQDYSIKLRNQKENLIKYSIEQGERWYDKYLKFIGLDKLQDCYNKVEKLEEDLLKVQSQKREIEKILLSKRDERQKIEMELRKVDRISDNEKFLEIIQQESKVICSEKDISATHREIEEMERTLFSRFCDANRYLHQEERLHNEYTKSFSYIVSIMCVFVGALLSHLVNSVRNRDLVSGIDQGIEQKMRSLNESINTVYSKVSTLDSKMSSMFEKKEQKAASWSYWDYVSWVPRQTYSATAAVTRKVKSWFGY